MKKKAKVYHNQILQLFEKFSYFLFIIRKEIQGQILLYKKKFQIYIKDLIIQRMYRLIFNY